MVTVRQIEKLWNAHNYARLTCEMLSGRPEASSRLEGELLPTKSEPLPDSEENSRDAARRASERLQTSDTTQPTLVASAVTLLRLDELAQSHVPLYSRLLKLILSKQDSDGGWGDPMTTALCLRALIAGRGQGLAIDRGMQYLAQLQKPEGNWPKLPLRRTTGDSYVSAFIVLQLGSDDRFRRAVRLDDVMKWFGENILTLDRDSRRLWDHAIVRCRGAQMTHQVEPSLGWS